MCNHALWIYLNNKKYCMSCGSVLSGKMQEYVKIIKNKEAEK